jgi:hypothetical protein
MATEDPAVQGLYQLPPPEFTAARNALATEMKKAGDQEGATRVKALKRPSPVAWALNQVAAKHPDAIARLVDAGRGLVKAQEETLAGQGPGLRDANAALQQAENEVERLALAVLATDGRPPANAPAAIRATAHAAALDDEVGAQLRAGTLTEAQQFVGFPAFEVDAPLPRARADDGALRLAREQIQRLESELATAMSRADHAAGKAERARKEADRSAEDASNARAVLVEIEERLEVARHHHETLERK